MPKFTSEEKEHISQCLLQKGKDLFSKYGLTKTSIDEIVEACGIAKGSFYKFYSTKEELFYVILKNEEAIRDKVLAELFQENLSPKELLVSFFHKSFQLVDENPLLQIVFQKDEYERIIRKLPKHIVEESRQEDKQKGIQVIKQLLESGVFREGDPEEIAGIIQATMLLRLQKEKIGEALFPKVMDKMIEFVAEGLTRKHL